MQAKRSFTVVALIAVLALVAAPVFAASNIPAGTQVTIRMGQTVDSEKSKSGDSFDGTLNADVVVNGKVVAKRGDPVKGRVSNAHASGRLSDPGVLTITLTEINGQAVSTTSRTYKGASHTKSNAVKIGGGAAAGALIGGLAGGGKGAAIGAGVGAGAGTGVAAATGKKNVKIAAEALVTFTVQ